MTGGQLASRRVAVLAVLIVAAAGCTSQPAAHSGTGASGSVAARPTTGAPSVAARPTTGAPSVAASRAAREYRAAAARPGKGTVTRTLPPCNTAALTAPGLPALDTGMTIVQAAPFGVSVLPDDRQALVAVGQSVEVFGLGPSGASTLVKSVTVPGAGAYVG